MTFVDQVLASFIGTAFGFFFAILLFLITSTIKIKLNKRTINKYLIRELEYDISLLQEWIEEIDKVLRKITANDRSVFSYFRYTFFQRTFIQQAFLSGILYNILNDEQISKLNTILLHSDTGIEQYINGAIQQWNSDKLDQKEALAQFEFEKSELQRYKKHIQEILEIAKNS